MLSKSPGVTIYLDQGTAELFYQSKESGLNASITDSEFVRLLLVNFKSQSPLKGNIKSPTIPSKKLLCPECNFTSFNLRDMSAHFDVDHSVEASFSCTCGSSYAKMPDFLRHYIECPIAATDLQDPGHNRTQDASVCAKKTSREEPGYNCSPNNIDQEPSSFLSAFKHPPVVPIKGPSTEKPFGCPQCPKGFKSKSLLEQHMHLHYPPRYKCRWCEKVYRWPPVYYHHMRICKKMPYKSGDLAKSPKKLKLKSECTETRPPEPISYPPKPIPKEIIPNILPTNHTIPVRQETHSQLLCTCNVSFPTMQAYFQHVAVCAEFLKPFRTTAAKLLHADYQPIAPNPEASLSSKVESNHLYSQEPCISRRSSKLFMCNVCSKGFTSKLSLKQHVDGKHRAEGKYLCQICGKRYRWGASFYYHRRTCISPVNKTTTDVPSLPPHIPQPSA